MKGRSTTLDSQQQASLGCGTLILIALIVLIFGNAGNQEQTEEIRDLRRQVSSLEQMVEDLRKSVERQSGELAEIKQMLVAEKDAGP